MENEHNGTKNTMSFDQWRDAVNREFGTTLTDKHWAYYDLTLKYAQGFSVSEAVDYIVGCSILNN